MWHLASEFSLTRSPLPRSLLAFHRAAGLARASGSYIADREGLNLVAPEPPARSLAWHRLM